MRTRAFVSTLLLLSSAAAAAPAFSSPGRSHDARQLGRLALERADRMASETLGSLARSFDACSLVAGLAANATVHDLRAELALSIAACVNEESGTAPKLLACLEEAFGEFAEGLELLEEQHQGRFDLCAATGGGIYDPDLDEDEFVTGVNHPYLPFLEGAEWIYQEVTPEGLVEVRVTVTGDTFCVDDIECIAVRDVVTLDGELVEDTVDWFAQHQDGTVWYMGEIAQNFEEGVLTDIDGSWRAGEDGGLPGIVMLAQPTVGTTYRQELLLTEAEDAGTVLSLDATVTLGIGTFSQCLQTADYTPVEPGVLEHKYYAPGIGLVFEVEPETGERLELVSFTPGS